MRVGYKLMSVRKDGSLGPLFINRRQRIPVGEWLHAEAHLTKGFAFRPGWHIMDVPVAPHLKKTANRVWVQVEFEEDGAVEFTRPASQGGKWYLANKMRVVRVSLI